MANRKKLRRRFFNNEVSLEDLTDDEKKYLEKYIRRRMRDVSEGKDSSIPTYKEVPCQMVEGKMALVPVDAKVVEGDDGKLYLNEPGEGNLIVSTYYLRQKATSGDNYFEKARKLQEEQEKSVINMEPTELGEPDGTTS